uniref:Uncharacterized protein n=1 Tax=Tanacetum cinerariifolium TaxID=118510 RepID=A0A6L2KY78_TANCI|nr:hypothetical protein [Tanacetum cinerariifolium]
MFKLLYNRFTKLIIDYFLSCNKNIPRRSDSELHSEGDDSPFTKLLNTVKEQNESPVKSGIGKGYMRLGDYEANVPNMFKKDVVPRKTRSLTVTGETVVVELAKSTSINEQCTQQRQKSKLTIDRQIHNDIVDILESLRQKKQAVAGKESSAAHITFYDNLDTESVATHYSSCLDTSKERANETNDADDPDMDLTNDEPKGDDDTTRYGVFMYHKSTETPKSTYFSLMITSSPLDFIQNLLDETLVNELMNLISNPVYTDAHRTSMVHKPKGNPDVRSFSSSASEVPFDGARKLITTTLKLLMVFTNGKVAELTSSKKKCVTDQKGKRFDDNEYEFSYADLPQLSLNDVEDMVDDIKLEVESYQQTLNLTKPMMFFEGIDQKIPFTMSETHKGVVCLNQHNVKSFMKLNKVKKFCDGTLMKILDNLIDMVNTNKLEGIKKIRRMFRGGVRCRLCVRNTCGSVGACKPFISKRKEGSKSSSTNFLIDSLTRGNDDIDFDFEFDLRELECLLNQDPTIDSSRKNNIKIIDSILEGFSDKVFPLDSFPPRNDDDLFDFEADSGEWKYLLEHDPSDDINS